MREQVAFFILLPPHRIRALVPLPSPGPPLPRRFLTFWLRYLLLLFFLTSFCQIFSPTSGGGRDWPLAVPSATATARNKVGGGDQEWLVCAVVYYTKGIFLF